MHKINQNIWTWNRFKSLLGRQLKNVQSVIEIIKTILNCILKLKWRSSSSDLWLVVRT